MTDVVLGVFDWIDQASEPLHGLYEQRLRGCNYVVCSFAWGSMPLAQRLRSVQLFVDEVMPELSRSGP